MSHPKKSSQQHKSNNFRASTSRPNNTRNNNHRNQNTTFGYQQNKKDIVHSTFIVNTIEEYQEIDNIEKALRQHEAYLEKISTIRNLVETRIKLLKELQAEKIFVAPSEYDEYVISSEKYRQIEERKREIKEKLAEQERAQQEKHAKKLAKTIQEIKNRWLEYWKCWNKYFKHKMCYLGKELVTCDFDVEKLEEYSLGDLKALLCDMRSLIVKAHEKHNQTLIENSDKKICCFSQWGCEYDDCHAFLYNSRMSGCGMKVYFDTEGVDFLDEITLEDTDPIGYLSEY
jgi:hypothetical protein